MSTNRLNIVLSKNKQLKLPQEVLCTFSFKEALEIAKKQEKEIFIIGGGIIYQEALQIADKILITQVHTKIEKADTYFPIINPQEWHKTAEQHHTKDNNHLFDFSFITYKRK